MAKKTSKCKTCPCPRPHESVRDCLLWLKNEYGHLTRANKRLHNQNEELRGEVQRMKEGRPVPLPKGQEQEDHKLLHALIENVTAMRAELTGKGVLDPDLMRETMFEDQVPETTIAEYPYPTRRGPVI